jgi:hypothetical protein
MSTTLILVLLVAAAAAAGWFMVSRSESGPAEPPPPAPSTYRCKVCGAKSATFAIAHEHASAEHDLAGHHIDESIEPE